MLKKPSYVVTLTTIAATIFIVSGATAIGQQGASGMPQHQQGMMDMSAMKREPHHLLAMAYKDNLVNFAKALRQAAAEAKTVNSEFARSAVAEMKRSFDQMQQHHQDHIKAMAEQMKTHMADMMKQMDAHHAAIKDHLAALDKEVHTAAADSKSISGHVAEILKQCDGMSKTHAGTMNHKMAGPEPHKMN